MLFLVKGKVKGTPQLPQKEWMEIVVRNLEQIQELKKQGKLLIHGGFVGRQAGCFIWDVDSNEELQNLMSRQPLWPFMKWKVIPLISTEQALESARETLAALQ